jgi:hypothetical protein
MLNQRVKTGRVGLINKIKKLRERQRFRNALRGILETEDGRVFFEGFLKHCHITKSHFTNDPYRIVEEESLRRLAMSYLQLLGKDNTDFILSQLEADQKLREQE